MALTKQQKQERVAAVKEAVQGATAVVFMAYDALTVDDFEELRDKLFTADGSVQVVPKRLLKLSLQQASLDFDPVGHTGQIAMVWGKDAVSPAKMLYEFARAHETITILAGVLEGKILSAEEVTALAQLPSREQLLGQLLSVMVGPLRAVQEVLSGAQRQLVIALSQVIEQKQKA